MYFVFEDSLLAKDSSGATVGYIGTSVMIQSVYEGSNVKLLFAERNSGLKRKLNRALSKRDENEIVVVFVDLVPDNIDTVLIATQLMKHVLDSNFSNVLIMPIPSIEFIFVKAFEDLVDGYKDSAKALLLRDGQETTSLFTENRVGGNKSFEKFAKACFSNCFKSFSKNRFPLEDKAYSFFGGENRDKENWKFITNLPVFEDLVSNVYFKQKKQK